MITVAKLSLSQRQLPSRRWFSRSDHYYEWCWQ